MANSLSIPEAVAETTFSRSTIMRALAKKDLPSIKVGSARRILKADLEAWQLAHRESNGALDRYMTERAS